MQAIKDLPHIARRSITFDRGSEFVSWPQLQAKIGTQTWFCDPASPLSGYRCAIPCPAVRGKKEPWRTPIAGRADGCPVNVTSG